MAAGIIRLFSSQPRLARPKKVEPVIRTRLFGFGPTGRAAATRDSPRGHLERLVEGSCVKKHIPRYSGGHGWLKDNAPIDALGSTCARSASPNRELKKNIPHLGLLFHFYFPGARLRGRAPYFSTMSGAPRHARVRRRRCLRTGQICSMAHRVLNVDEDRRSREKLGTWRFTGP